jgi:hypothetical protein
LLTAAGEHARSSPAVIVKQLVDTAMRRALLSCAAVGVTSACAFTVFAQGAQQEVTVGAQVPPYCAIAGAASQAALNTVINVDPLGMVDTTPQVFTVPSVVCNVSANVLATSQRGGAKASNKSGPQFTNIINYRGTAAFGSASSTINTGALKGADGPEPGNLATTAGPASGTLTITVRPTHTTTPIIHGTDFHDTLRITLTPD